MDICGITTKVKNCVLFPNYVRYVEMLQLSRLDGTEFSASEEAELYRLEKYFKNVPNRRPTMKFPSKEEIAASSIGHALGIVKDLTDPLTWWPTVCTPPESYSLPATSSLPAIIDESVAGVLDALEEPVFSSSSSSGTSLGVLADVATSTFDDPDLNPIARLQRKQDRLCFLHEQLARASCDIDIAIASVAEANEDLALYQADARVACDRAARQADVVYNAHDLLHRLQMAYHTLSVGFVALAHELNEDRLGAYEGV